MMIMMMRDDGGGKNDDSAVDDVPFNFQFNIDDAAEDELFLLSLSSVDDSQRLLLDRFFRLQSTSDVHTFLPSSSSSFILFALGDD